MKKDTTKKTVVRHKPIKILTLEDHYYNYYNSKTIEEKQKHYDIINEILKCKNKK